MFRRRGPGEQLVCFCPVSHANRRELLLQDRQERLWGDPLQRIDLHRLRRFLRRIFREFLQQLGHLDVVLRRRPNQQLIRPRAGSRPSLGNLPRDETDRLPRGDDFQRVGLQLDRRGLLAQDVHHLGDPFVFVRGGQDDQLVGIGADGVSRLRECLRKRTVDRTGGNALRLVDLQPRSVLAFLFLGDLFDQLTQYLVFLRTRPDGHRPAVRAERHLRTRHGRTKHLQKPARLAADQIVGL